MIFMQTVSVHEAKTHLSKLLRNVSNGEEVIITNGGKPVAKLTAFKKPRRQLGDMKGQFTIPEDFDAPMPDEWFFGDDNDEDVI